MFFACELKYRPTDGHVSEIPGMNWRTSIFIFKLKGLPAKLPPACLQALDTEVTLCCRPSRDWAGAGLAAVGSPHSTPVPCARTRHQSNHSAWDVPAEPRQGLLTRLIAAARFLPLIDQSWQKRDIMVRRGWHLVIRRTLGCCFSPKRQTRIY